jgi:tetratricopeptide (TPR) repeat protein
VPVFHFDRRADRAERRLRGAGAIAPGGGREARVVSGTRTAVTLAVLANAPRLPVAAAPRRKTERRGQKIPKWAAERGTSMANQTRKEQILEMLAANPTDPELTYFLAMEHLSATETNQAVKCFQDVVAMAPDYVPAYVQLGQLLTRLEREDEARHIYRSGIAAARQKGDTHAAEEMGAFLDSLE